MRHLLFPFLLLCMSCKQSPAIETEPREIAPSIHPSFVTDMEEAHHKSEMLSHEMICFNLDVKFGSSSSRMKVFSATNSSAIKVEKGDGTVTLVNDDGIFTNADKSEWDSERFGVFTYQYFFMFPYKLSDPGTTWSELSNAEIDGRTLTRHYLTFEENVGDAPDDWYIVHSDQKSKRISHVGYIVTAGGIDPIEAEQNAHAIHYGGYQNFRGIPISTEWSFHDYNKNSGIGKKIGSAKVRNVEFMDSNDEFKINEDMNLLQVD